MGRHLVGGYVQRISVACIPTVPTALARRTGGTREVALLAVRTAGETHHLVVAAGLGVGRVDTHARARLRTAMRDTASPAQAQHRRRLEGGRLIRVADRSLDVSREGKTMRLGEGPNDRLAVAELDESVTEEAIDLEALDAAGARLADQLARAGWSERRGALERALGKAIARVDRRLQAVRGDLARTEDAGEMAHRAQLFVAAAANAPRGATRLTATDWTSGEPRAIELAIDPGHSARDQIDALFRRARRLKQGATIAQARLVEVERVRARLSQVEATLAQAALEDAADDRIEALAAEARSAAPRDFKLDPPRPALEPGHPRRQPRSPPYREFVTEAGARILVGRGAAHNDALTLHVARPHDLWLHAKNRAGAHVVVPLERGAACPPDLLIDAAHLAAHFSEARRERVVEVQVAERRHLRKPRGSAPGLVVVDREKVLLLRDDPPRLRALLERELAG